MHYGQLLDRIHQFLLPRVYLEIGIRHGNTLALAMPCTQAIGVDPSPDLLVALGKNVTIHEQTSDEFFSLQRPHETICGRLDVAFIDGMHLLEFAFRDFCNIERCAHPDSVVFIHDCLPRSPDEASRVPMVSGWTGDVWKLLPLLSELRPDLEITMIEAPPTGLVMIRGLDPESTVLDPSDELALGKYTQLDFEDLQGALAKLPAVKAEWEVIQPLLPLPYQSFDNAAELLEQRNALRPDLPTRLRRARRKIINSSIVKSLLRFRRSALRRFSGRDGSTPAGRSNSSG